MITYIYVICPSSLGFTQQTVSRIKTWSLFQRIYTLLKCNLQSEKHWKCIFFSYSSNHIVSSFSSTNENEATYQKLVCFEESISFSSCLWCDFYTRYVTFFSFISCRFMYDNKFYHQCVLLIKNICFLSINAVQSLVERSTLYISWWNTCFRKWQWVTGSWHDHE